MHPSCPNLIAHYDQLTDLKEQFDTVLNEAAQTGQFERVQELKTTIESVTTAIEKLMLVFVEVVDGKEITLDVLETVETSQSFYDAHDLPEFSTEIASDISFSEENTERIREALRMGFDRAMIIPGSTLQSSSIDKLTELANSKLAGLGVDDPNQYSQDAYFEDRGDSDDVTKSEINNRPTGKSYMLMYKSGPIPQETKDKNPDELDELFKEEKWTGMTLPEYLVLQRKEAEERGDHSFDAYSSNSEQSNWTWLLDSTIGSDKVVSADWYPGGRRVRVDWAVAAFRMTGWVRVPWSLSKLFDIWNLIIF